MEYNDLDVALKNAADASELRIDFREGKTLTDAVGDLHELEALHLRHCPPDLELPQALLKLPKLRTLSLSASKDELTIPKLAYELAIDALSVWDCAVAQLAPFKSLRVLYVVVKNPKTEVADLARLHPQLVSLDVWGSHLKKGELPPDIGAFTNLEVLRLVSCGLLRLPEEIAQLKRLRELRLGGIPMMKIPDVVCELSSLESLEVGMHVTGLPENLPRLEKLRFLNLRSALNNGAMLSRFDEEAIRMKPLPKVLSQMTELTRLYLDFCGVVSTEGLAPLTKLTTLSLAWAAMPTLADIARLTSLETLRLPHCDYVTDFSPLAHLVKLNDLDISSTRPDSLEFLKSLPALRRLDITGTECTSLSALYSLEVAELKADDDVLERWNNRALLRGLPDPESIKERLAAGDAAIVEAALLDLAKHVAAASSEDENALNEMFGSASAHEDPAAVRAIPLLDDALNAHLSALAGETLTAVFGAALRRVEDNFEAARIVTGEIVRRHDAAAQLRLVESFESACENYDAGHRYQEDTVHDQLIDVYFPDFEAAPLAELLAWCRNDHLNGNGGDDMASLFAPAFSRVADDGAFARLTDRLGKYTKDQLGYGHGESVDRLFASIEGDLSPSHRAAFTKFRSQLDQTLSVLRSRAEISADAESRDVARIEKAIARIDTLGAEDWSEIRPSFWYALDVDGVARESCVRVLEKSLDMQDDTGVVRALIGLIRDDAGRTRELFAAKDGAKEALAKHLRAVLLEVAKPAHRGFTPRPGFPGDFVRTWAEELDGISAADWRRSEVVATFQLSFRNYDEGLLAAAVSALAELPGSIDLTAADRSYGGTLGDRLADLVGQMVTYADKTMLALARQLHKIELKDKTRERILAQLVGLSAARDDHEAFDALSKLLPSEITNAALAYNLACTSARRGDREALLRNVKRALELGKSPTQMRDDSDFAAFLDDPELHALLEAAL